LTSWLIQDNLKVYNIINMRRFLFSIIFFLIGSVSFAVSFKPPTLDERQQAIGSIKELSDTLRKAWEPGNDFEVIATPRSGDWLAEHAESGQGFDDFVQSRPNRPDKIRNKIYLQPLGNFPQDPNGLLERLTAYAGAYFAMEVKILPGMAIDNNAITARTNPFTRNRQILTRDVLAILKKDLPYDAFCKLAITMLDLYPDPAWNFVFGQASLRERVGVYSFARYDPAFYGQKREKDYEKVLLRRSYKVLAHETCHMFGLTHCIFFKCSMNGSNHLKESDSRPLHLCPVCLRKLQHSIGFDVTGRYRNLFYFYQKVGFDEEAQWVKGRLEWILTAEAAQELIKQKSAR